MSCRRRYLRRVSVRRGAAVAADELISKHIAKRGARSRGRRDMRGGLGRTGWPDARLMKLKNFICGEDWAELNDFCFVFLHQGRQLKGKVQKTGTKRNARRCSNKGKQNERLLDY